MKFKARPTIIVASLIQLALGSFSLIQAVMFGEGRLIPCMVPTVMTLAAVGGLMVQHPAGNPILRPLVIGANIMILVLGT